MGKSEKRQRYQFKFWLDCSKDEELLLAEEADNLKRRRLWQPTIRDALRLILDLRNHKVEVLLLLFPWIEDFFRAKYTSQESPANIEFAQLIERQTAILERLAMQPVPVQALPAGQGSAAPKPLNIPKFNAPTFDDDDLDTIPIKRDTSTDSTGNFFKSLSALTGSAFVEAAPEDPGETRKNFAAGMGNLFADDEDDDF